MTTQPGAESAIDPAENAFVERIIPSATLRKLTRAVLRTWRHNHAARCGLLSCARLDPRFANDIGLTQGDIVMAARMPFWIPVPVRDLSGERS